MNIIERIEKIAKEIGTDASKIFDEFELFLKNRFGFNSISPAETEETKAGDNVTTSETPEEKPNV